jgi:hypothetical protein
MEGGNWVMADRSRPGARDRTGDCDRGAGSCSCWGGSDWSSSYDDWARDGFRRMASRYFISSRLIRMVAAAAAGAGGAAAAATAAVRLFRTRRTQQARHQPTTRTTITAANPKARILRTQETTFRSRCCSLGCKGNGGGGGGVSALDTCGCTWRWSARGTETGTSTGAGGDGGEEGGGDDGGGTTTGRGGGTRSSVSTGVGGGGDGGGGGVGDGGGALCAVTPRGGGCPRTVRIVWTGLGVAASRRRSGKRRRSKGVHRDSRII